MAADPATPIDARLYRAALRLCPGEFRRDHGDEMRCDFDDARREAAASSAKAVWAFRLLVSADLGRTVVVQWLRTGRPVIGCTAAVLPLLVANAVASVVRRLTIRVPHDPMVEDVVGLVLLAAVALMVIVATIVFNGWMLRPRRPRRR
jgi:hypothetical protein